MIWIGSLSLVWVEVQWLSAAAGNACEFYWIFWRLWGLKCWSSLVNLSMLAVVMLLHRRWLEVVNGKMSLHSEGWGKLLPADVDVVSLMHILFLGLFLCQLPVTHLLIEFMRRSKFPDKNVLAAVYWFAPLCKLSVGFSFCCLVLQKWFLCRFWDTCFSVDSLWLAKFELGFLLCVIYLSVVLNFN